MLSLISLHSLIWGNNLCVIKSYYSGFSSSGVVRIKISLFAGRFLTPTAMMFLPIFKGMSEAWQCTSSQIPRQIVFWGINNIYCHIWAIVWATGLHFWKLHVYVHVSLNFLGKIIPSRPSGSMSHRSWHTFTFQITFWGLVNKSCHYNHSASDRNDSSLYTQLECLNGRGYMSSFIIVVLSLLPSWG